MRWILSPALALALSACADFGGPVNGRDGQPSPEEMRLQRIESGLAQLNRRVESMSAVDMAQQLNRLSEEVRELRGQVEQLRYDVDKNEQRARELYLDLDRRLQDGGAAPAPSAGPDAPAASGYGARRAPADPAEQQAYNDAFDLLRADKVDAAVTAFRKMLEQWPDGRYADNAQYWIGEGFYVQRQYEAALKQFNTLLQEYPGSSKVPDAMLKIGFSLYELKQTDQARSTLQRIVDEFPDSAAATLAKPRLELIERNG